MQKNGYSIGSNVFFQTEKVVEGRSGQIFTALLPHKVGSQSLMSVAETFLYACVNKQSLLSFCYVLEEK